MALAPSRPGATHNEDMEGMYGSRAGSVWVRTLQHLGGTTARRRGMAWGRMARQYKSPASSRTRFVGGLMKTRRPRSPCHARNAYQGLYLYEGGPLARERVGAAAPSPAMQVADNSRSVPTPDPEPEVNPPVCGGHRRLGCCWVRGPVSRQWRAIGSPSITWHAGSRVSASRILGLTHAPGMHARAL